MENKNNTEEKETKQDTINQISKSNQGKHLIKARNKMQILVVFHSQLILLVPNESASSKPEQNRTTENEKNKIGISKPTNKTKENNTNTQTKNRQAKESHQPNTTPSKNKEANNNKKCKKRKQQTSMAIFAC